MKSRITGNREVSLVITNSAGRFKFRSNLDSRWDQIRPIA